MLKHLLISFLALCGFGGSASAALLFPGDPILAKDTAVIDSIISSDSLVPINEFLVKHITHSDIPNRILKKPETVNLIINSPGGSVFEGFRTLSIMDAVRESGTRIRCFVPDIAASMAFSILLHCDERYAMPRAGLLWHRVSVGGIRNANALNLSELLTDLLMLDNLLIQDLKAHLNLSDATILYHLDKETMHLAPALAKMDPDFIQVYTYIPGLYEAIKSKESVHQSSDADFLRKLFGGQIIYIAPGVIQDAK